MIAYEVGLRDVLYDRRRYGRQASPDTSPREHMTQQGTMGHAHIGCLLEDDGCWLQDRACMHATQVDGAGAMTAAHQHQQNNVRYCLYMYMHAKQHHEAVRHFCQAAGLA